MCRFWCVLTAIKSSVLADGWVYLRDGEGEEEGCPKMKISDHFARPTGGPGGTWGMFEPFSPLPLALALGLPCVSQHCASERNCWLTSLVRLRKDVEFLDASGQFFLYVGADSTISTSKMKMVTNVIFCHMFVNVYWWFLLFSMILRYLHWWSWRHTFADTVGWEKLADKSHPVFQQHSDWFLGWCFFVFFGLHMYSKWLFYSVYVV